LSNGSRGPRRRLSRLPRAGAAHAARGRGAHRRAGRGGRPPDVGPAPPLRVLLPPDPEVGIDVAALDRAASGRAGAEVEVEVLVAQIADDEERFLNTLAALDEILAAVPGARVAIVEPSAVPDEVAARGALLAEVAYRTPPRPHPDHPRPGPACNSRCVHCAVADLRAHRPGGDPASVERALADLAAGGADRVMFGIAS